MIPQTKAIRQAKTAPNNLTRPITTLPDNTLDWRHSLADVVRSVDDLFALLKLDPSELAATYDSRADFPLRVPREFVARMKVGDINDPLLKQILPLARELDYSPGFSHDPLQETNSNPCPGLIHKYQGRVLLIVSGGCAVNCRYCFRRHFPYQDNNPGRQQWQHTLDYIRADNSIHEVIFSGGDPLAASDKLLAELSQQVADIPHIHSLRIHSRLPIVIPQRINSASLEWMTQTRLHTVMVVHCNHANEIDHAVGQSLNNMKSAGITVLNQSVLLAGVNDCADTLIELSERLFRFGTLPYYLHQLDKVQGAGHFLVSDQRALELIEAVRVRLPGYLVPKLVREQANARSKTPINNNY